MNWNGPSASQVTAPHRQRLRVMRALSQVRSRRARRPRCAPPHDRAACHDRAAMACATRPCYSRGGGSCVCDRHHQTSPEGGAHPRRALPRRDQREEEAAARGRVHGRKPLLPVRQVPRVLPGPVHRVPRARHAARPGRGAEAPRLPPYCVTSVDTCEAVTLMSNADVLPELPSRRTQFSVTVIGLGNTFAITNGSVVAPGIPLPCAGTTVAVVLSESTMLPLTSCASRLHLT